MVVPNSNYCKFEEWLMPILDAMLKEQLEAEMHWTPSKVGFPSQSHPPSSSPIPTPFNTTSFSTLSKQFHASYWCHAHCAIYSSIISSL